jgi:hypothetical protein
MTTQTATLIRSDVTPSVLLRRALRIDQLFCATSGTVLLLTAKPVADFMGTSRSLPFAILGALLLGYALVFFWNLSDSTLKLKGWLALEGNALWVAGSIVVLVFDLFSFSTAGKWMVLIVTDIVLILAIVQVIGLRRRR